MSDVPRSSAYDAQRALVGLHALAGTYGGKEPSGVSRIGTADAGTNLRTLAAAPLDLVPASARIGVLYRLAKAGYPQADQFERDYEALAATVSESRGGMSPVELLDDLRTASAGAGLSASRTVASSPHHEVAFLDQDVCSIRRVTVDGRDAVWIFSEFETDAPFESVAQWVDPRNWPDRSPLLFRRMEIVGADQPVAIAEGAAAGDLEHWHSVFHEEVQLVQDVNTLLHCDFRRDGSRSAGMTYELTFSPDDEINVDRGFLLVTEVDGARHVKALKIVGFVDRGWNDVAELVCPIWTDFIRQAVRGGQHSGSLPPSHTPPGGSATPSLTEGLEPWIQFFGTSAMRYLQLFDDVTSRVSRGGYSTGDLVQDGRRYWSQLAKDWARAWTSGTGAINTIAEQGLDAGVPPPTPTAGGTSTSGATQAGGARFAAAGPQPAAAAGGGTQPGAAGTEREEAEGTTIAVSGLTEGEALSVSPLVSIEAGAATIPAVEVTVDRVALPNGSTGVHVQTRNRTVPPGLYVGELTNAAGQRLAAVQLYLSRATGS